jgi:hypothetical protein
MKHWVITAAGLLATMAISGESQATMYISGNICQHNNFGGTMTGVTLEPWGATNSSTSATRSVNCALPDWGTAFTSVKLFAYDRSTTTNISCNMYGFNTNGDLVYSAGINGTTGGGPGSSIQKIETSSINRNGGTTWTVTCTIPAAVTLSGTTWYSHIVGFQLG